MPNSKVRKRLEGAGNVLGAPMPVPPPSRKWNYIAGVGFVGLCWLMGAFLGIHLEGLINVAANFSNASLLAAAGCVVVGGAIWISRQQIYGYEKNTWSSPLTIAATVLAGLVYGILQISGMDFLAEVPIVVAESLGGGIGALGGLLTAFTLAPLSAALKAHPKIAALLGLAAIGGFIFAACTGTGGTLGVLVFIWKFPIILSFAITLLRGLVDAVITLEKYPKLEATVSISNGNIGAGLTSAYHKNMTPEAINQRFAKAVARAGEEARERAQEEAEISNARRNNYHRLPPGPPDGTAGMLAAAEIKAQAGQSIYTDAAAATRSSESKTAMPNQEAYRLVDRTKEIRDAFMAARTLRKTKGDVHDQRCLDIINLLEAILQDGGIKSELITVAYQETLDGSQTRRGLKELALQPISAAKSAADGSSLARTQSQLTAASRDDKLSAEKEHKVLAADDATVVRVQPSRLAGGDKGSLSSILDAPPTCLFMGTESTPRLGKQVTVIVPDGAMQLPAGSAPQP